ncbi:hexose kinase [Virgibacillus halophilus]|uniref:Hexose kinase n=1 Tax=Tigheibacillus halophilus TaxID=361280 RepID=A0ABU5C5G9_9BACI|nr:hexose kinase [Virgibacillus halophilus]
MAVDFIHVEGITRINTFIRSGEIEYKAVNKGPEISETAQNKLLEKLQTLTEEDMLFVSGSLPKGIKDEVFIDIAKLSQQKGFQLIWDISSESLINCLPYHPFLIKPNDEELAHLLGVPALKTDKELIGGARELMDRGAGKVLVSLGEKGALYVDENESLFTTAPIGKVVNTACAGDTMLAVFVGKLIQGENLEEALICATAAGSSTAFSAGLTDLSDLQKLKEQIKLRRVVM